MKTHLRTTIKCSTTSSNFSGTFISFPSNIVHILIHHDRVQLPPINSSFISNCGFSSKITEFAVLQLAVSLFPRAYFTEIITFLEWYFKLLIMILLVLNTIKQEFKFQQSCFGKLGLPNDSVGRIHF